MSNKLKLFSVIIPCYNEGKRILPVLAEIKKSNLVREIIVVDDGSDYLTKKYLENIMNIKLITHPQNLGKSAAMKSGVLAATGKYLIFIDSDLKKFTVNHLNILIEPLISANYQMVIGDRENESWYGRLTKFSIAYTGERAVSRKLLIDNIDIFKNTNYSIEAAMNQRFYNNIKIAKVKLINLGQYGKNEKIGFFAGYFSDIKMTFSIIKFLGIFEFINQLYTTFKLPYCNFNPSSSDH